MSDSVVSDSTLSFFKELPKETLFFFNLDLKLSAFILILIVVFILTASITASFLPPMMYSRNYENFSNEDFYSYKNINYSNYSSIPLTAQDVSANDNTPNNILFGKADRIITTHADGKVYYSIEVNANLYILGGQVYDDINQKPVTQTYTVQLVNPKNNKALVLGNMIKDGDGIYKLKYKLDVNNIPKEIGTITDLIDFSDIQILYIAKDTNGNVLSNTVVLQGGVMTR